MRGFLGFFIFSGACYSLFFNNICWRWTKMNFLFKSIVQNKRAPNHLGKLFLNKQISSCLNTFHNTSLARCSVCVTEIERNNAESSCAANICFELELASDLSRKDDNKRQLRTLTYYNPAYCELQLVEVMITQN